MPTSLKEKKGKREKFPFFLFLISLLIHFRVFVLRAITKKYFLMKLYLYLITRALQPNPTNNAQQHGLERHQLLEFLELDLIRGISQDGNQQTGVEELKGNSHGEVEGDE